MEIKNKLTVTVGRGERVNRRKKGKDSQRTCIKYPSTRTTGWGVTVGIGEMGWGSRQQ